MLLCFQQTADGVLQKGLCGENLLSFVIKNKLRLTVDDLIKLILTGYDVNHKDDFKMTPLHRISERNFVEGAKILIESGALKTAQNFISETPLMYAIK